jgi:dihydroxy-acid dehydratase
MPDNYASPPIDRPTAPGDSGHSPAGKDDMTKRSDKVTRGPERGPHRSLMKAAGMSDRDIRKPLIAVVNSYAETVPGHVHLDAVGEFVRQQVAKAGGTPILFNTIAICDGIAMGHRGMKYSLLSRELIADCIEAQAEAYPFDAMICIPNCDKIVPGMFLASLRLNIPTVFASGGPMEAGRVEGRDVDLIDQFYAVARNKVGAMSDARMRRYENNTCPTCGSCSGMFTANSMNCLAEAIGMAMPGNGTTLATNPVRRDLYQLAARRVVEMATGWIDDGLKKTYPLLPRRIMTKKAFRNAFALDMAMGGSTNTVLHLLAMANEAGVPFSLKDIEAVARKTPNICRVAPSATPDGTIYHIQDVHKAGGIHTILWQLWHDKPSLIADDAMTVTGRTLGENLRTWSLRSDELCKQGAKLYRQGWKATGRSVEQVRAMYRGAKPEKLPTRNTGKVDPMEVIRPVDDAYTAKGGLAVLYGNIARDGSVVKLAGVDPKMYTHSGPARIFESQEAACEGILGGAVQAGDVVVIRNEGPRGGPGMQEMLAPTSYIKGMGLGDRCALITDGRFSGGTAGACIGHISPEAASDGEIGLLEDGDVIEIDIPGGAIDAKVSKAEFERRRKARQPRPCPITHGAAGRYAQHATSADTGAVLDWPGKTLAPGGAD